MFQKNDRVKKITDGQIGKIVNQIQTSSGLRYQVQFDNEESVYLSEDILQPYQEIKTPIEAFSNFQFSGIDDYKRVMTFQRLAGDLTNMFYSMNNSLAKPFPHQFLPVTKFLQSPEERILIADEVGLGKTVEAMYIWKELEARRNAKRLLVVCPATLREKWKRDMKNLFAIKAEIVKADKLLETFQAIEKNRNREQFAYICSMESIRAKKTESYCNSAEKLNKAFEEFSSNYSEYAFNLVIIDEAHYLRNRETANFKTAVRLRDIAESLVLLSATPIQTGSENLYSLMNILSPEQFDNSATFDYMLKKDEIFIKLANCLQRSSSTIEEFEELVQENQIEQNDLVQEIKENEDAIFSSAEKRMRFAEDLRSQIFYSNLFNRTRRRFVFKDTAKRKPHAVKFNLSLNEMNIYNRITQLIRNMSKGHSEITTFALIARQRQMASCLPAAFKDWQNKAQNFNFTEEDKLEFSEFDNNDEENEISNERVSKDLKPFYLKISQEFSDIRYEDLQKHDSKYKKFLESVKELLAQNPKEKILVFSFFRGTNEYLEERLKEDGISAVAIKGGMGALKDELLEKFRTNDSINLLISSEVGSEGLDLQFASIEYNYDLPWNPMRLEQRIGRIDRIGQESEILRIFNLCCQNTVEDRILERLYERVKIFENSIGDMEDIVGQPIQDLALETLNPELTDEDRQEKAEQKIQVLVNQRIMNNKLEDESGILNEYRNLVLNYIKVAEANKRSLDKDERIFIVKDFLENYYSGSTFFPDKNDPSQYLIGLSNDAILAFREFRKIEHVEKPTEIDSFCETTLVFSSYKEEKRRRNVEVANLDHPIFDWIKWTINKNTFKANGCSAITLKQNSFTPLGNYIYYIQKWKKYGVEKSSELKYFMADVDTNKILDEDLCERIMNTAITKGSSLIDATIRIENFESYHNCAQNLINYAWDKFENFVENYKRKSKRIYNNQINFVNFTASKKIDSLQKVIETLKAENKKQSVIYMHEKRIEKINKERELKLNELEKNQFIEPELSDLAIGILIVE